MVKPTLNVLEACHCLAPIEEQKENKRMKKIKLKVAEKTEEKAIEVCPLCGSKVEKGFYIGSSADLVGCKEAHFALRKTRGNKPF